MAAYDPPWRSGFGSSWEGRPRSLRSQILEVHLGDGQIRQIGGPVAPGSLPQRRQDPPPASEIDRSLVMVYLGREIWEEISQKFDPPELERRISIIAYRSTSFRRWKSHLLERVTISQAEEVLHGT